MLELYVYTGFATALTGWIVSEGIGPNEHPWWVYAVVAVVWPWAIIWFLRTLWMKIFSNS